MIKSHYKSRHTDHKARMEAPVRVSGAVKRTVTYAAVFSVVLGTLSLNFLYRHDGMLRFAESLVTAGQSLPPNVEVDVAALFPSPPTVRDGVTKLSSRLRESFKGTLPDLLKLGGGLTCDGLKLDSNGRKYYDLIIHYIEVPVAGGDF